VIDLEGSATRVFALRTGTREEPVDGMLERGGERSQGNECEMEEIEN